MEKTFKEYLNENHRERYVLLQYDDYNEDFEHYGLDFYEVGDIALNIAKNGGVEILSDKRLYSILLDSKIKRVIGCVWVSDNPEKFSFDISLESSYRNMGLSKKLIESALEEYNIQKEAYDDMGEDFKMEVDVINPKLEKILKEKYNFYVVDEIGPNRVLMSVD
jgi:hypothetical protein